MQSAFPPGLTLFGVDQVVPLSVDVLISASFALSVRNRPSSKTAYSAPDFGSTAAAGSPSDARCARTPFEWFSAISIGGWKASGSGYGVEPAFGAEMNTWLVPDGTSGSSPPAGSVGVPGEVVSSTMPSPPLLSTIGYAPIPCPGKTTGDSVWKFGSQFARLSQSWSQ